MTPDFFNTPSTNVSRMSDAEWAEYQQRRTRERELAVMGDMLMEIALPVRREV
jgi:hypothetical protein